mmetsp:Transcript_2559/g.5925  ORF Transcript_2559/g.5925 Transcript_2559/m.5925 type:complete len:97 (-) Transcript_2559:1782-2072(-)
MWSDVLQTIGTNWADAMNGLNRKKKRVDRIGTDLCVYMSGSRAVKNKTDLSYSAETIHDALILVRKQSVVTIAAAAYHSYDNHGLPYRSEFLQERS